MVFACSLFQWSSAQLSARRGAAGKDPLGAENPGNVLRTKLWAATAKERHCEPPRAWMLTIKAGVPAKLPPMAVKLKGETAATKPCRSREKGMNQHHCSQQAQTSRRKEKFSGTRDTRKPVDLSGGYWNLHSMCVVVSYSGCNWHSRTNTGHSIRC